MSGPAHAKEPRKKKRSNPHSTHKDRAVWFNERTCWPLRDADPTPLERVWHDRSKVSQLAAPVEWEEAGPFNIGGRATSLAVHPANHLSIYAGAAAGGVWHSGDGGRSWQTHWPKSANPHIGALAIDPQNPHTIYCATGEANLSADSYPGSGIYISRDAGDTWNLLAAAREAGLPRRIGTIAVHPRDPKVLYLGGVTHDETTPAALFASSDGGKTWDAERFFSSHNYWCHSIVFHSEGLVFATLATGGAQNGIWRLDDDGWKHLTKGLPPADVLGRIALTIAPSEPDTMYALVGDWKGKTFHGVFRSRNRGERWEHVGGHQFSDEHQSSYNNAIAVHPDDPDFAIWGGIDLYLTRDGGNRWVRATQWDADPMNPSYAHSDHHALAMPAGNLIYTASDGGVAVSEDAGKSWSDRSRGMNTTMFYSLDVAPRNGNIFGGGAQDNGTLLTGIGGAEGEFQRVLTGDGGGIVFDPGDETHVLGSSQNLMIYRHSPGTPWDGAHWKQVPPKDATPEERAETDIAVMAIDPHATTRDPHSATREGTIWLASRRLWRTSDYGGKWRPGSEFLDGTQITAVEIAPANPEMLYVGTSKGSVFRSSDAGQSWSGNLSGPEIPMRLVSQIRTHPRCAEKVVLTVAGTGTVSRLIPQSRHHAAETSSQETAGFSHVFYSEDSGDSWRAIDGPDMPDVPYKSAVFESHPPYRLFVGNDAGVFMTEDLRHWIDLSATLPNVIVNCLVYHHADRTLTAATYGRGIWRLRLAPQSHNPA